MADVGIDANFGADPGEVRHESLIPVVASQTVRRLPQIVSGRWSEAAVSNISSAALSVDFVKVLRPCIASLKLEPMPHPLCDAGLQ